MIATIAIFLGQSAVAAALVTSVAFLGRSLIEARLTRAVQHEFDKKLTKIKAQLDERNEMGTFLINAQSTTAAAAFSDFIIGIY